MELTKKIIGLSGPEFVFEVEKGHIRKFAEAIGDSNPLYVDEEYAINTVYGGIIAPPTFPIVIGQDSGDSIDLGLNQRRMLHGEQEFIYRRPIRAGDILYCQMKVTDVYEREGRTGQMQFLVLDTEMKDEAGKLVVISRTNIVYRPLKNSETGVKL
ncbi:MaoC family dehydratase N-terminal domain-containing protein [Peribacillus psychrosaccharolyticus]|uniref:MaoC family dehydratase N-terminal domain-containing protein n=1 Tax=Peribacillus psychrosaccharolyticus TaxID=1407 RepID=A0A974NP46_PERPY|nr:MaoC family dehydratase N-terminal domain-containing protein [Peribacillus psychrosaccharolyticus]MEC2057398.1 MaoC family dehydratase N-terminal domain-containing protein [Peribacillus psychrosaccharolyticus]MED3742776.1 MaoC family dehydratase N-terminal domain-containing protein [Peribacillus psychrosaccharolyticus]QQT01148.1 MaoC family dehydratase N-terminal domain-containing protein [Peribacillus psychrosaccharolyticus]